MNRLLAALSCIAFAATAGVAAAQDTPSTQVQWTLVPLPAVKKGADKIERGKAVFERACEVCHGAAPGHPGTISLQAKYQGSVPAALEERKDITPELVKFYVRHGIAMMAALRTTELSNADLDDLAAYLSRKKR